MCAASVCGHGGGGGGVGVGVSNLREDGGAEGGLRNSSESMHRRAGEARPASVASA